MLNRWPYSAYQSMAEYKSSYKTVLVDPRGDPFRVSCLR